METYQIVVSEVDTDAADGKNVAAAYGDLDTVAYHGRRLKDQLEDGKEYVLEVNETDGVYGDEIRKVASATGDPEIILYVLAKRIRAERKRQAAVTTEATPA